MEKLDPSETSMLGVQRHLTEVEYWWFQDRFAGIPYTESRFSDADPDGEFKILESDTVESLLQGYEKACKNSRQITAGRALVDLAAHPRRQDRLHPNFRWVYLQMIDESARHGGQLQIYREVIDGSRE